ncbi:MAG TPA: hypothetical protein VEU54_08525, partial [Steroidobacteraceae bacterium]|nr:hypothetical protein [Steroidobacteraceae bacterium]
MNRSRRHLLQALSLAPVAATMPALAGFPVVATGDRANRLLVLVFLYGGNDGFNTWVPYTDETYYRVRPTIAVPRDAVIKATDHHGFHPSLAALAPIWEAKELALLQGIGYRDGTQQHFRDLEVAFTACDGDQYYNDGWVTRAFAQRSATAPATDAVAFD